MESTLSTVLISICRGAGEDRGGDPLAAWDRRYFPFLLQNQKERSRKAVECAIVSTISFIQANLQHSITASRFHTRTVAVKGIDIVLIQEARYRGGRIMDLNIPGYTLFCAS